MVADPVAALIAASRYDADGRITLIDEGAYIAAAYDPALIPALVALRASVPAHVVMSDGPHITKAMTVLFLADGDALVWDVPSAVRYLSAADIAQGLCTCHRPVELCWHLQVIADVRQAQRALRGEG